MRKPQSAWTTILQIFLLILIIIGVVLLSTTSHWVPSVVSFILKSESPQENSALQTTSAASTTHSSAVSNSNFPISSRISTSPSTSTSPTTTPTTTPPIAAPLLYSIKPSSGAVGSSVTITGNNFANLNTVLFDGNVAARNISAVTSPNGASETLAFTVPSSLSPDCKPNQACPMYVLLTSAKTYSVTIENESNAGDANKRSNALQFTVTGGTTSIPQ